ncbi:MAG: efflux RND transporter periplasmic adaptor subunit [Bacteroidales bacterium]|nr:efflux RND transporter periplasmic adaptor subunit [Bacteroidales bacterium]
MKTLKYSIILSLLAGTAFLFGCKGEKTDEHGHTAEIHAGSGETESHAGHDHGAGEAEAEGGHEELPDDIVELNAEQIKVAGIEMGKVQMRQVSGVIKANGIVSTIPQNTASVSVPLGGFVKSSNLLPGIAVIKGQTLATIENMEFVELQQNYFEIRSKYEFAYAEYKRHTELYENDVYSQKNLQQTTSDYLSLKARLKGIEQKLSVIGINAAVLTEENISAIISLRSPISGYITTANISMGKYVSPSDVLFEIVNKDKLLLELTLFEKDANSISIGQVVHFAINNESHEHNAVVYQVGKSINADKTYKVYATVQQPCVNVLPGMYVLAHIEKTDKQVAAVPADAVVSFDNKHYILAYEKDKEEGGKPFTEYRFIEVVKGETNDGFTEIQPPAGFDLMNTKIVTKGAYILLSAKKNAGEMTCG